MRLIPYRQRRDPQVTPDRDDFALIFEVAYFVLDAGYAAYLDIQQEINLQIHAELDRRGIRFAYPTTKQYTVQVAAS